MSCHLVILFICEAVVVFTNKFHWHFLLFFLSDPLEDVVETNSQSVTNSAAELLKQGAGNDASKLMLWIDIMTKQWWHSTFTPQTQSLCAILGQTFFLVLLLLTVEHYISPQVLLSFSSCDPSVIWIYVFLQPVMCGTSAPWRWSHSQASRRCRKPPVCPWAPTLHQPPPLFTSRCLPRESPSLTTRGSG